MSTSALRHLFKGCSLQPQSNLFTNFPINLLLNKAFSFSFLLTLSVARQASGQKGGSAGDVTIYQEVIRSLSVITKGRFRVKDL